MRDEHDKIQAGIMDWARLMRKRVPRLKLLHAISNGVMPGVFDLFLPMTVCRHGLRRIGTSRIIKAKLGLYLEVKLPSERNHKDGGLSPDQVAFRGFVTSQGYEARIAYTTEEGIKIVHDYLWIR